MMKLLFSTRALVDMDAIAQQIQESSPRTALRFLDAVENTSATLLRHPELGARFETDEPELADIRICLLTGFEKYVLFYRIRSDGVYIERVVYGARDLPNLLKEEK